MRPIPAVRSAAGPISVPACDAPISMGMPSKAMCGLLAWGSDMRGTFKDRTMAHAIGFRYALK